jgi:hypothetical protein
MLYCCACVPSRSTRTRVICCSGAQLTQPDGYGCVLFIYSVMLTRTLPGVMSDFDTALGATARLISAHNYAAQVPRGVLVCRVVS